MYSHSQDSQRKPPASPDRGSSSSDLSPIAACWSEGTAVTTPVGKAHDAGVQPEGSMQEELLRLRNDLREAWERLESLERLLCRASDDSAKPPASQSARRKPADADSFNDAREAAESSAEPDAGIDGTVADATSSGEEQAIREYMERLLGRVGGASNPQEEAAEGEASPAEARRTDDPPLADGSDSAAASAGDPSDELAAAPTSFDSSRPDRSQDALLDTEDSGCSATSGGEPGPDDADLRAMRALANAAAKTVIIEFDSKQHARLAMDKLLVMLVCLPCGMLLLYWYSVYDLGVAYIAASIAFFAVALWGAQALRLLAKLTIARLSLARLGREPVVHD